MKLPIFSPENRSTYRVAVEDKHSTLWVGLPSGPLKVRLDDVSSRGCGFSMDLESAEDLAVGSELVLRMKVGPKTSPQLFIRSEIRGIREADGLMHIGVAFKDCDRLYHQLDVPQWLYFNRRGAFRVPPCNHRGDPLRAGFYDYKSTEEQRFTVNDLSSTGLSIRLSGSREFTLSETQLIRTKFELPGIEQPFDLRARFIHRTFVQGVERIGMKFDESATRDFDDQSELILGYVLERQSQILRR